MVLVASALLFNQSSPLRAEKFGDWETGFDQGFLQYFVENGAANTFAINCDVGRTGSGEETYVVVHINGKDPAPRSLVTVVLDGEKIQLPVDDVGDVKMHCPGCSSTFEHLWKKLRESKTMTVRLESGQSSRFSLKGAQHALQREVCGPK